MDIKLSATTTTTAAKTTTATKPQHGYAFKQWKWWVLL